MKYVTPYALHFTLRLLSFSISLSVFSEMGYINQLFSVSDWLPTFKITGQVLINLSNFLGGLAGPLSTYFAGKYTAGHYGRSTGTAGVTSLLVSLIIGSQELLLSPLNDGVLTRINLPDSINIIFDKKEMKKLGFKFVGPTIVYSWLQAVGIVNDHLVGCPAK